MVHYIIFLFCPWTDLITYRPLSSSGHGDRADNEQWPRFGCRYVISFVQSRSLVHIILLTSSVSLQATRHLTALTSRGRSTSTRWRTTTTPASSSATRTRPVSTWWCGSRRSRRTGSPSPSGPRRSRPCSSRSLLLFVCYSQGHEGSSKPA